MRKILFARRIFLRRIRILRSFPRIHCRFIGACFSEVKGMCLTREEAANIETLETRIGDQVVEVEIRQAFPTFLICADGTLVEPDGTLVLNPEAGEIPRCVGIGFGYEACSPVTIH
jgi:hypothetical protein